MKVFNKKESQILSLWQEMACKE